MKVNRKYLKRFIFLVGPFNILVNFMKRQFKLVGHLETKYFFGVTAVVNKLVHLLYLEETRDNLFRIKTYTDTQYIHVY